MPPELDSPHPRGEDSSRKDEPKPAMKKSLETEEVLAKLQDGDIDMADIERRLKAKNLKEPIIIPEDDDEDSQIGTPNIYSVVLITGLLMATTYLEFPVNSVYEMREGIYSTYNDFVIDDYGRTVYDVRSVSSIVDYLFYAVHEMSFLNVDVIMQLAKVANVDANPYHFIGGINSVAGLRFTTKRARLIENKDPISKDVIKKVKPEIYDSPSKTYDTEEKEPFVGDTKTYKWTKEKSFNDAGGYVVYLPGNSTYIGAAVEILDMYYNNWFDNKEMVTFAIEYLFYNPNFGRLIYMSQAFLVTHSGTVELYEKIRSCAPELYDSNQGTGMLVLRLILNILFQVIVLYDLLKVIFKFIYHALDLFAGKKVFIPTNDIAAVITVSMCLTCIIYWYALIFGVRYFILYLEYE